MTIVFAIIALKLPAISVVALTGDGEDLLPMPTQVVAWGDNQTGACDVPTDLDDAIAVDAGYYFSVALRANGTVVAWGLNDRGQCDVPADLNDVVAIAAGYEHTVALKSDGTVAVWGSNRYGQLLVPEGLEGVLAIDSGEKQSVVLKSDGSVAGWSAVTDTGQVNSSGWFFYNQNDIVQVASGGLRTYGVNVEGNIERLSIGTAEISANLGVVNQLAVGTHNVYAILGDGKVVSWGKPFPGMLEVTEFAGAVALSVDAQYALALFEDGTVAARNDPHEPFGLINLPEGLTNNLGIAAGYRHALFLRDPSQDPLAAVSIMVDGDRFIRPEGDRIELTSDVTGFPTSYQWYRDQEKVKNGRGPVLIIDSAELDNSGTYKLTVTTAAGDSESNLIELSVQEAPQITGQPEVPLTAKEGASLLLAINATGNEPLSYQWYYENRKIEGAETAEFTIEEMSLSTAGAYQIKVTDVDGITTWSGVQAYILAERPYVVGWGHNPAIDSLPGYVQGMVQIAAGYSHALGLRDDGTVIAWGSDLAATEVPEGLNGVIAIAAGAGVSFALQADGSVAGWGDPLVGSLSDPYGLLEIPQDLPPLARISVGQQQVIGMTHSGELVYWGKPHNDDWITYFQDRSDLAVVDAGSYHLLGVTKNGEIFTSGDTYYLSSARPYIFPNLIADAWKVSAGGRHSLVLRQDGSVIGSGYESLVQYELLPEATIPAEAQPAIAVFAGNRYSLAITEDRHVVAWGNNDYGQINVPSGLRNALAVAASGNSSRPYSLALVDIEESEIYFSAFLNENGLNLFAEGLGWLDVRHFPWVYQGTYGWLMACGEGWDSGQWMFYDPQLGWWAAYTDYPEYIYRYSTESWIYMNPGTAPGANSWLYDFLTSDWVAVEGL